MAWLSPAHYAPGDAELDLLASIASEGKTSRLYQSLVYEKKLAQSVVAYQASKALQSYFTVQVVARPGIDLDTLETAIDEQLALLRTTAVTKAELARAATSYEMGFVTRMQSLERRASLLNGYFASLGDPGWVSRDLARYQRTTPPGLLEQAQKVLTPDARVILRVVPRSAAPSAASGANP